MLLRDLHSNTARRMEKINKLLRERFGFSLASEVETGKLNCLYKKIADDLYNLKLDLSTVKDKEYTQKLLVAEGLKLMLEARREKVETLREAHLVGPGAHRYESALNAAAASVEHACSIGDDYEEAIHDAMKAYRSSELRFPDEMFEYDLREMTQHCTLDAQIAQYEGPAGCDMDPTTECYESEEIDEKAPPGMEDWIKDRKAEFKKQYGDRWQEVLYATAWKEHNKKNESLQEDAGHSILDIITPEELDELREYANETRDPLDFIGTVVYEKLFEYYMNSGEMPYGIAKGRTGDPDQWILDRVCVDYADEVCPVDEALGGGPKGKAQERSWRDQLANQKTGDLNDFFASRAQPKGIKKNQYAPIRRQFEHKTTDRKENMKEGYVKQLRKLLEAEVEQAESLIAARSFSQELQDMVEKLGRLVNEDLPAVAEQMRDAYGADIATGFENTVSETLNSVMDTLRNSKQEVDNSVSAIADGQAPVGSTDMGDEDFGMEEPEDELGGMEEPDMDMGSELELDDDDLGDLDDIEDVSDDDLLGRAKKESVNRKLHLKKQIMEMQKRIARIKAKRTR